MNITTEKEIMIFRNDYNGKTYYSAGLSKKDKDGSYVNWYIKVNFKKGVDLQNKTKIKIGKAWLDFYNVDNKTIPIVFISEFDIVDKDFNEKGQVVITDKDLSMFDDENIDTSLELPF